MQDIWMLLKKAANLTEALFVATTARVGQHTYPQAASFLKTIEAGLWILQGSVNRPLQCQRPAFDKTIAGKC